MEVKKNIQNICSDGVGALRSGGSKKHIQHICSDGVGGLISQEVVEVKKNTFNIFVQRG